MCKEKLPPLRAEVAAWMRNNRASYMEFGTGEPEFTQIAEAAANMFDHDEWLDDELHWIWEEAITAFEGLPA
jgi:hypothetical protein